MANQEHLRLILQGVDAWNGWREKNPGIKPDLRGADLTLPDLDWKDLTSVDFRDTDLSGANLSGVDLRGADFSGADVRRGILANADLSNAILRRANFSCAILKKAKVARADLRWANFSPTYLRFADLSEADLRQTDFSQADLRNTLLFDTKLCGANLRGANLSGADLDGADFTGSDLTGGDLVRTRMINTNFENAILTGCKVYGISAWDLKLAGAIQSDLVVTGADQSPVSVDNLQVAQFIYLLLNSGEIRGAIDTIVSKVVLILGRFTPERKVVLDALRGELRDRNWLPVVFDWDRPASRNLTETVSTLAHMARFVIADITDAKSIPQELQRIVPDLPSVPVQPVLHSSFTEYAMFSDFFDYPTVLIPYRYDVLEELLESLEEKIIMPAVLKAKEIADRRKTLEREMKR